MKIHIELKKKRYILYAAIIALLGVVGANISILHTNADKIVDLPFPFGALISMVQVGFNCKCRDSIEQKPSTSIFRNVNMIQPF